MAAKFRIENGQVVRVGGPPSKEEQGRVRRNRRALGRGEFETPREPASLGVTRTVNGESLTEEEFQARCEERREQLDANMSGILESRKFPGVTGDDTTFQNAIYQTTVHKRFSPEKLAQMRSMAEEAGVHVDPNAEYYESMADFDKDPKGWVNPTESRSDVARRIAAEGNGSKELGVKVRPPESDPNRRVHRLAPDLVKEEVQKRFAKDPGLAVRCRKSRKTMRALKQEVIATHGAKSDTFE